MKLNPWGLLLAGALVLVAHAASAEPRLALVIGNSNYGPEIGRLPNPANDADLIGKALEGLGFKVVLVKDADQGAMKRALSDFGKRLVGVGPGSTALFYYAGHGVQVSGTNYLIPVGAVIKREAEVEFEAVEAESVLRMIEFGGGGVSVIILDACRNNPFPGSTRSAAHGLARMEAATGSFIAYSTAPGETAVDGTSRNSPFAKALAEEITKPGAAVEEIFRNVRGKVIAATNNRQVPWDSSSLTAPFYFSEPKPGTQTAAIVAAPEPEPEFESPLPDGTIVLSPRVAAQLEDYLKSPKPTDMNIYGGLFYVSEDGHSAGSFICPPVQCYEAIGAIGAPEFKVKVKQKAQQICQKKAKGNCILLYAMNDKKQKYEIYGQ